MKQHKYKYKVRTKNGNWRYVYDISKNKAGKQYEKTQIELAKKKVSRSFKNTINSGKEFLNNSAELAQHVGKYTSYSVKSYLDKMKRISLPTLIRL